jgi:CPA2 family monovalent cation:H+ antiporter-2
VLTLPHTSNPLPLVLAARELNPSIEVMVRGRYVRDREMLQQAGATTAVVEEGEVGVALARQVMKRRGIEASMMERMTAAIRRLWSLPE